MAPRPLHVAVVGAGWAGLAAAVEATARGHAVTLMDMAPHAGGRARSHAHNGVLLDNGQHILIGAYHATLALMRQVGVSPEQAMLRRPLCLVGPDGRGLRLPGGAALPSFVRGVLRWTDHRLSDRLRLLALAARWRLQGFRCAPEWSVRDLAHACPPSLYRALLDPLCVAALNTPADRASAQVLLTVLHDALFSGPGASDLLLPRVPLSALLPEPALQWLQGHGARWQPGRRAEHLLRQAQGGWQIDGEAFDHVVLACSAAEASRLLAPHAPTWAAQAAALRYEPIITVWLKAPTAVWSEPMLAFDAPEGSDAPAQFGFDLGALGGPKGLYAMVVSGAGRWVERGPDATALAVQQQWTRAFGGPPPERFALRAEKRATFACVPNLQRPEAAPLPHLTVAGDHVVGPYPATLEGAVRSGRQAIANL